MPKKRNSGKISETKSPHASINDEDVVRLKPFLGIRPGIYLAFIYGVVIATILFFILLYPGISNPGSLVSVKSEPSGAAVLVDGVYMGFTPSEIFIPRGSRKIEMKLPGFATKQIEKEIGGRLFASLLLPLKDEVKETLFAPDPAEAFLEYAKQYAAWAFSGEPSVAYQIPMDLSDGAYRLAGEARDPGIYTAMNDTITASSRFAATRAGLRDLLRAKNLLESGGQAASPMSLLSSAADIIAFLDENPAAALWLGDVLSGDSLPALTASSWYMEAAAIEKTEISIPAQGSFLDIGSLRFRLIEGGDLTGINFPGKIGVGSFYICETVISESAWERFIEENPKWKLENMVSLEEEGLVTSDYLSRGDFSLSPDEGISGISWHAAKAFCEWLSRLLPPQYSSREVRLPTEAEWEYAAVSGAINYGDYWEWCNDPFAPLNFLSTPETAISSLGSPERSLRGGSWINRRDSINSETRGSLPPSFCSVFVSARPVIALKRN